MKKLILAAIVSVSCIVAAEPADMKKDWQTVSMDDGITYTYTVQPATVKQFFADGELGWVGMVEFEATGHAATSGMVVVTGCVAMPSPEGLVAFLNEDGTYVNDSKPFAWSVANIKAGTARTFERIAALVCVAGQMNANAIVTKPAKIYTSI